jgi:hypothetical protein
MHPPTVGQRHLARGAGRHGCWWAPAPWGATASQPWCEGSNSVVAHRPAGAARAPAWPMQHEARRAAEEARWRTQWWRRARTGWRRLGRGERRRRERKLGFGYDGS